MSPQSPGRDTAAAGAMVIASLILCAVAGYGVGTLVDLAVPFGLAGLFAGFVLGLVLVHARFRRV
jgi:hypothetical protein